MKLISYRTSIERIRSKKYTLDERRRVAVRVHVSGGAGAGARVVSARAGRAESHDLARTSIEISHTFAHKKIIIRHLDLGPSRTSKAEIRSGFMVRHVFVRTTQRGAAAARPVSRRPPSRAAPPLADLGTTTYFNFAQICLRRRGSRHASA
ncbi:hypothetical protein EVAR_87233_1 [Eumeta japonica]|uniref:Uncharacterized protein n=1 Tax=Eumeta variegata TaxID=151549 RepID=A0A4C1YKW6_EUMVA|nr:hypothetical protein EVAR_87233_1 [Eumeta japonica]